MTTQEGNMNYQQSYPGMWIGPVIRSGSKPDTRTDDERRADLEADWIEEQEHEAEMAIDEARDRRDGRYDC